MFVETAKELSGGASGSPLLQRLSLSLTPALTRAGPMPPDIRINRTRSVECSVIVRRSGVVHNQTTRRKFSFTLLKYSGGTNHSTDPRAPQTCIWNFAAEKNPIGNKFGPFPPLAFTSCENSSVLPQFLHDLPSGFIWYVSTPNVTLSGAPPGTHQCKHRRNRRVRSSKS